MGAYLIATQFNYKIGHVFSATLVAAVLVGCGGGAVDDAQQSSNQTAKGESRFLKSANANIDSNGILTLSAPTTSTTVSTASTTDTTSTSSGTAPAPTAPSTVTSPVTYDQLIGDMSLPHEGVVNGVNPAWDWGSFPKTGVGVNFPADYDNPAVDPWGIAGTDAAGSPATNVRVQIRKVILDVKRNNTWSRIVYNSSYGSIVGALYTNYETNTTVPANIRDEGVDGISVKLPTGGGSFHFYTQNRFSVPFGAQEIVTRLEARLIVDDPSKTDDRSTAKILVNAASDVWRNQTALWSSTVWNNEGIHIGRFKYVDSNWQSFSAHTFQSSTEVNDYLAAEPNLLPR